MNQPKKVDNYSILIVAKYLQSQEDYINLVCVCKNYKKTLKKFRYNPIAVHNTKLFPLMQTQYIYTETEKKIEDVELYRICYPVSYHKYLEYQKEGNIKCSKVYYDKEDGKNFDGTFPEIVHSIEIQALLDNEIASLTLPTFITSLEESCFARMTNLTSLQLSPHINSIPFGMIQFHCPIMLEFQLNEQFLEMFHQISFHLLCHNTLLSILYFLLFDIPNIYDN